MKVVDHIGLSKKMLQADLLKNSLRLKREEGLIQEIHSFPKYKGKVITLSNAENMSIFLDIKEIYDNREWGRNYHIETKKDTIIITFEKLTDYREDQTSGIKEFKAYVVIKSLDPKINLKQEWVRQYYAYDHNRGSPPFDRFLFYALDITTTKLAITFGDHLKEVENKAAYLLKKHHRISNEESYSPNNVFNKEVSFAYDYAVRQLEGVLIQSHIGKKNTPAFMAGLPWFFQVWSRDDCISAGALQKLGMYHVEKDLLWKYLHHITPEGRIPNRFPASDLSSADAVGLLFLRIGQLIEHLSNKKKLRSHISKKEIQFFIEKLRHCIYLLRKYYVKGNLIYNKSLETWMDTDYAGDTREGFRIEIQALLMNMYKIMHDLTDEKQYLEWELEMKKEIKQKLWNGKILADGLNDFTIRPNIFLAAYYFYDLLQKDEWKICFSNCIEHLWLPWGGIASIDKQHSLYTETYTGENNRSYHRGDSWYFVNNITAMMLYKTDPILFQNYITKIVEASTRDILEQGIIGVASELSSAKEQSAAGCLAQTWSAATFIEMVNTINKI